MRGRIVCSDRDGVMARDAQRQRRRIAAGGGGRARIDSPDRSAAAVAHIAVSASSPHAFERFLANFRIWRSLLSPIKPFHRFRLLADLATHASLRSYQSANRTNWPFHRRWLSAHSTNPATAHTSP